MVTNTRADWIVDPSSGNLRLALGTTAPLDQARRHELAQYDIDGALRPIDANVDIGADELSGLSAITANGSISSNSGGTITVLHLAWLFGVTVCIRWRIKVN